MKKIYTLGLALFVGVAVMAADNGPHKGTDTRSSKENTSVRTTNDWRRNGDGKVREQNTRYSSRYGNDTWANRNERNDNWAYANDRHDRDFDQDNRGYNHYDRSDEHDRSFNHNDRSYDRNDHSYGNSKTIQRRF